MRIDNIIWINYPPGPNDFLQSLLKSRPTYLSADALQIGAQLSRDLIEKMGYQVEFISEERQGHLVANYEQ